MSQQYQSFKGTAKEFMQAGVSVNGKVLDQPAISLMAQYGVIKIVGAVERREKQKGHAAKIYQINGKSGLVVKYNSTAVEESEKELVLQ